MAQGELRLYAIVRLVTYCGIEGVEGDREVIGVVYAVRLREPLPTPQPKCAYLMSTGRSMLIPLSFTLKVFRSGVGEPTMTFGGRSHYQWGLH